MTFNFSNKSTALRQEGVEKKVTALLLSTYSTMAGENAEDKWNKSLELVKSMAGYGDGKTLEINSFDENQYRGWGPLRHKQVGNQIIFTNTAEAGRNYNGISQYEIDDMLDKEYDINTLPDDIKEIIKGLQIADTQFKMQQDNLKLMQPLVF